MSAPEPASPLAHLWKPGRHGAGGADAVTISVRNVAIVQVTARRGEGAALRAAMKALGGHDLPGTDLPGPGRTALVSDGLALAIAPETWAIVGPREGGAARAKAIGAAIGATGSLVDLSMARVALRICGTKARDVLARGCRLDLHPRAFGPGRVAVTPIAHVTVMVTQIDAAPTFELLVPATFAETFLEWLLEAAAGFGADLAPLPKSS